MNRKHHFYCSRSALQKKCPNIGACQGPFSRTCIRESAQASEGEGQLLRVHEGHSVPTWHKGCSPSLLCHPQGAEPPQHWQRSWGWGAEDGGWQECSFCQLCLSQTGVGAAVTQSGTWGRGEHWKLNTALSNHESPKITLPPPDTHTCTYTHSHIKMLVTTQCRNSIFSGTPQVKHQPALSPSQFQGQWQPCSWQGAAKEGDLGATKGSSPIQYQKTGG